MSRSVLFVLAAITAPLAYAQTPTWNEDIACIVYTHCTPCHHDGGAGHFSLTTYTDAVFWRNEMRAATQVRYMPPWPPDPAYRRLAHERVLTQEQVDLIAAWVDGGYPEGEPENALPPPTYNDGPELFDAEISAVMPDFAVPPSSSDLYRCFVLNVDNPADRFITAMEVIPGNRAMVHHVLVFEDVSGQARILDDNDPAPGYTSFGGIGVPGARLIGVWVPGTRAFRTATAMGIELRANADVVIQVHYPPTSEVEVDSTRILLSMSSDPALRRLSIDPVLRHSPPTLQNGPFVIPAGEVRTFHSLYTVPADVVTTGIAPHAHLICTRMSSYAVTPQGDTIRLIDIPDWDFRWQGFYDFRNPVFIPQGSQLHGYATYDNTAANPNNPSDPPQTVTLGEATTDEMMLFYFAYTPGVPSDTLIVIDDGSGPDPYMDCDEAISLGTAEVAPGKGIRIWPSPAVDRFLVANAPARSTWRLLDATGRQVEAGRLSEGVNVVDRNGRAAGAYFIEVLDDRATPLQRAKLVFE